MPDFLVPASEGGAALQFFVEAMKANTAALQQVSKTMQGMQDEQKETLRLVHDTRERVIKIESGGQPGLIAELKADVENLKSDKLRRDGATNFASGAIRNAPAIITLISTIVIVAMVLFANGKL